MNKKKYVRKSQVQNLMNTSTIILPKTERPSHDRSLTQSSVSMRMSNFDSDEDQNQATLDLTFDDKKILHLWLVELLPGKFTKIKVNLTNKKISGNVLQCEKKIDQCNQYLGNHVLKSISDLNEKINNNFKMIMDLKFKLKIFQKELVEAACKEIAEKFKYKQIQKTIQRFINKKIYYLVSVCKNQGDDFSEWFEQNKSRSFTRDQIANQRQKYKLNRNQSSKSLLFKQASTFSKVKSEAQFKKTQVIEDEQKQSSIKDESSEEEQNSFYDFCGSRAIPKKQQKVKVTEAKLIPTDAEKQQDHMQKKKKYKIKNDKAADYLKQDLNLIRTDRKLKNVLEVQYPATVFDYENFKKWVRINKILCLEEFQCQITPVTVKISLTCLNDPQSKLSAFKMYLEFEKLIMIDTLGNDNKKAIEDKYCQEKTNYLKCEVIEGYREHDTHEHRLRRLIKQNRINKNDKRNQKFAVVWIVGLSPLVEKRYKQLEDYIDQLPKMDKQQNIFLDLQELEQYILQESTDRIKDFISSVITEHIKKYNELTLIQVKFPANKVVISTKIKYSKYDQFTKKEEQQKFINGIKDCFQIISDIIDESDLTTELNEKYILCRSIGNPKKFVLITDRNKGNLQTKQILYIVSKNNSELRTIQIRFKKGRLQQLKNFIEELQNVPDLKTITNNIKFTFDENLLQIFGTNKNINVIEEQVKLYLQKIDDSILEKTLFISDAEAMVVEKNMKKFSQEIQNQFKLDFNLSKGMDFGAVFAIDCDKVLNLDSPLIIFVEKHKNILKMPNQTLFCFQNQNDLNFCNDKSLLQIKAFFSGQNKQNISKKEDTEKDYTYVYSEGFKSIGQMLTEMIKIYSYKNIINRKIFAFIMPKVNKCEFVLQIFQTAEKYLKENVGVKIKIHIFEDPSEDIKKSLSNFVQKYQKGSSKVRYYVFDQKQFYYSKQGDQKIDMALQNNQKNVYLTNQDLSLEIFTHTCSFQEMKLIHNQSGKQTKLQKRNFKDYYFEIKGIKFFLPEKQVKIVQDAIQKQKDPATQVSVSVGAYELDLVNMKQYNLFSGFTRDLKKKEVAANTKGTGKLFASFDEKVNEIEIAYEHKQEINAKKACQRLKQLIESQRIKLDHVLDHPLTKEQFQKLKCIEQEELSLTVEWDGDKKLTVISFDKTNISIFLKNLKFYIQEEKQTMKLPETWVPEQKSQIETFVVAPNTRQFSEIQAKFTIGPIVELLRIQNLLVYKKYHDEKVFLTKLNKGVPVKTMNLFHGTRSTDPKQIYEDKEQSFNINYTSDSNYLGRGTYFAETPQYSHNYRYTAQSSVLTIFSKKVSQMFYCQVLVGDSQRVTVVDQKSTSMKDTDYKNPTQRIRYESATTFTNNSNIYTVYKNRRAYPHYLIRY